METKGRYKLTYTLDKELKELTLEIEIIQTEGILKKGQNVWRGVAKLDGKPYTDESLSHSVNAKLTALKIGHKMRNEIRSKSKKDGVLFRVKSEEIL